MMNDINLLIGFFGLVSAGFLFCNFIVKGRAHQRHRQAIKDKIMKEFDDELAKIIDEYRA